MLNGRNCRAVVRGPAKALAGAKSAFETCMSEVGKMSETLAASAKDSMKPLNERVRAAVERLQAAR